MLSCFRAVLQLPQPGASGQGGQGVSGGASSDGQSCLQPPCSAALTCSLRAAYVKQQNQRLEQVRLVILAHVLRAEKKILQISAL